MVPSSFLSLTLLLSLIFLVHSTSPGQCTNEGECLALYPNCETSTPDKLNDGSCDTHLDNEACGFDGGDCLAFSVKYPKCNDRLSDAFVVQSRMGDGDCHNYVPYNTPECGFDGGDCLEFNSKYPNCKNPLPQLMGDGKCQNRWNIEECGWDGGDCLEINERYPLCDVQQLHWLGNGRCDRWHNTEACGFDGGDCKEFNEKHPDCDVEALRYLGNEICKEKYNTEACGYDGGDCKVEVLLKNSAQTM